jgi:hypothetical protein
VVGNAVSAMLKTDSRTPICQALGDLDELREAVDRLEVYQRLQPEHFDRRHMNARLRTRTETPEGGRGVPHVYRSESGLHPELWRAYRHGDRISTAFVESAVNQVVSKRFCKR